MKRILSFILVLSLVFCLTACGNSDISNTTASLDNRFRVGYAREDITPKGATGLAGFGNDGERLHKTVLDPLYLTCVAVTDAEDNTFMFVTIDITGMEEASANSVKGKISKETGIPVDNITVSGTHTHSAPSFGGISMNILKAAQKASAAAMEDRAYADMYIGDTNTKGLNFVRSYFKDDGSTVGSSYATTEGGTIVKHVSDADTQMQLIRFKREDGKKDVVMVNWQAHNSLTGGMDRYDLSADWVGTFRISFEQQSGALFAYFQGAAGNLDATSRIAEENAVQPDPRNHVQHGALLAGHAMEALGDMTPVEPGLITFKTEDFIGECFHGDGELVNYASDVIAYFNAGHTVSEANVYARQFGIHSIYHAKAISGRSGHGATEVIPITTVSLGNVAFATIPGELFDSVGKYIKEESPFDMTFILGYCNGAVSYLPSKYAFTYGSYEVDISAFVEGTAEAIAERHLEFLRELKQ